MKKITILLVLLLCGTVFVSAQNIAGRVVDAQGNPLPGASVYWAARVAGALGVTDFAVCSAARTL